MSYSWVFEPGVLTCSTAYAYMTGKYAETGNEIIFATITAIRTQAVVQNAMNYEGHTNGLSANLSWNVLVNDYYAYYFGARWQRYEFTAHTDITWTYYDINTSGPSPALTAVIPLHGTGDVRNTETITAFYAGVNYLF